jgi:hypothetical protein
LKTLTWKLIPKTDDALKPEVIKWAAFYEHRCKMGAKQIFHLEAFVAKYMRLYERYVKNDNEVVMRKLTCAATRWVSISTQPKRKNCAHLVVKRTYKYEGHSNVLTRAAIPTVFWSYLRTHVLAYISLKHDVTA